MSKEGKIACYAGGALGVLGLGYFLGKTFSDKGRRIKGGYYDIYHNSSDNSWNLAVFRNEKSTKQSRHLYTKDPKIVESFINRSMEVLKKMKGEMEHE